MQLAEPHYGLHICSHNKRQELPQSPFMQCYLDSSGVGVNFGTSISTTTKDNQVSCMKWQISIPTRHSDSGSSAQ